jgi:pimeloyl-ACP methyl ester carboxylesterase
VTSHSLAESYLRTARSRGAIEAGLPGARLEVLGGCSHYAHLDRPQHFVKVVLEWAATQGPAKAGHYESATRSG